MTLEEFKEHMGSARAPGHPGLVSGRPGIAPSLLSAQVSCQHPSTLSSSGHLLLLPRPQHYADSTATEAPGPGCTLHSSQRLLQVSAFAQWGQIATWRPQGGVECVGLGGSGPQGLGAGPVPRLASVYHPHLSQALHGRGRLPGHTHVGHRPALFPRPDNQALEVGSLTK